MAHVTDHDTAIPAGLSQATLQQLQDKFGRDVKHTDTSSPGMIPKTIIPAFQMPFMRNQKWLATTYTGHYPDPDSIDLRRYKGNTNASLGEPVVASAGGTVSEVGSDWYGDWVYIDHGDGWKTYHVHINKLASIAVGTVVVRGQRIGHVGKFGDAQHGDIEPHLHYTQVKDGKALRVVFNQVAIDVHAGAKKPNGSYPTQTITSANTPTGISVKKISNGASATCTQGAGLRVVADFLNLHTREDYTKVGPWVCAKETSKVHGFAGHPVMDSYYEILS